MSKKVPFREKRRPENKGGLQVAALVASAKCFALLKVLLYRPGYEMYQNEIVKASGLSPNTAVPLLRKLAHYGIIKERTVAGTIFYSIVEENPVVRQLKALVNVANVYELTRDLAGDVDLYLFGSAARGEDTESSDIDLVLIAGGDKKTLSDLKDKIKDRLEEKLKRDVNPVVFTPIEYARLPDKDKAFYESIEKDKIRVL